MPSSKEVSGSQPPSVGVVQEGYGRGPSETSLLPNFGQHIAAKIWNGENKWHPKVKIVYDNNPKRYAKIVEVQIVQQQRSTFEQLERASSLMTFRDQR
ncbi:hypothetical protein MTR_4g115510 [Medicago truncatula]|uniref:Uncharacterized protein n=1 Tax=Medicago truncatula TaxID=3880 RepID=G7JFE2_MEDTR|nr:hypothetical protein MTR_4g115510 [Medicago truncatula]